MDEVPRAFAISDIQSSPAGDERSDVCQLCQKQHGLWMPLLVDVRLTFERAEIQMDVWYLHERQKGNVKN